jgi:hypothetical protein
MQFYALQVRPKGLVQDRRSFIIMDTIF